ncbi:MAG: PF20097 family protein [Thermoplasmata archaeon]|nr:PF20097 family protein [Thermoplasmata archaeon]
MPATPCPSCGTTLEDGFLSTSNGSGIFWAHHAESSRLRPHDLEVLVPTGFMGTYSANLAGGRCPSCGTMVLRGKAPKPA